MSLPTEESIAAGFHGIVDALSEHRELLQAMAAEATMDGSALAEIERRLILLTKAYLLHRLGPRPGDELDVRAQVMATVGLATCVRIGLRPPDGIDADRVIAETTSMLATWLEAAAAAP
jgi:hypothetical protein